MDSVITVRLKPLGWLVAPGGSHNARVWTCMPASHAVGKKPELHLFVPEAQVLHCRGVLAVALGLRRHQHRRQQRALHICRRTALNNGEHEILRVNVRSSLGTIALKRFLSQPKMGTVPRLLPAVLVVHDGPGLPSFYLEPLLARLCIGGRASYTYDQLGCGLSVTTSSIGLPFSMSAQVHDLFQVLSYLSQRLGEPDIHLVGHGFGGALIMEALLRHGLCQSKALPRLRSVVLFGAASSTRLLNDEGIRLMHESQRQFTYLPEDAIRSFWIRHVCGVKPQPSCLSWAYEQSFPAPGGQRWGPLAGWDWKPDQQQWFLRDPPDELQEWALGRQEVAHKFHDNTDGGVPMLSLRGANDFVTECCVLAWRGAEDAAASAAHPSVFREEVFASCGHNAHLEDPDGFAAKVRLWLLEAELGEQDVASGVAEGAHDDGKTDQTFSKNVADFCLLGRGEARRTLAGWASALSWMAHFSLRNTRPSRFADPGFSRSGVASHLDGRVPAREARRLAVWVGGLPEAVPASGSSRHMGHHRAVRSLHDALRGMATDPLGPRRLALGLLPVGEQKLGAVACLRACSPLSDGASAQNRNTVGTFEVVGIAAAPSTPKNLCLENATRYLDHVIAGIDGQ